MRIRSCIVPLVAANAALASYPSDPLECFEVTTPVLTADSVVDGNEVLGHTTEPEPPSSCQVELMDHVFANSYGNPFVGKCYTSPASKPNAKNAPFTFPRLCRSAIRIARSPIGRLTFRAADYEPPSPDSCPFNRVVMNFTVVSEGRQFDRLAIMWLGDTEVWRTSTAEPKPHPGIHWTYWKDMTPYVSLWKEPQKLIFDLGNLINEKYTGSFNATLTATFINDVDLTGPQASPADQIVPFSAHKGASGQGSAFTYPDDKAEIKITLPQNIKRAVVSVSATGQSDEEFWWSNVPESGINTFNGTTLLGKGSFREVRLRIDDQLAGLAWPYPVVFTGGISPPLHRPVVGIQAFNLREQEIDISPWLGVLCNGKEHTFSMEVVGANDLVVNRYWLLSAKVFLWLDDENAITRGCAPRVTVGGDDYDPHESSVKDEYLRYDQTVTRTLDIRSKIRRHNETFKTNWSQKFAMRNTGSVLDSGNIQNVTATYKGEDRAIEDSYTYYFAGYSYPIANTYTQKSPDGEYSLSLDTNLTQVMDLTVTGKTVFSTGLEPFLPILHDRMSGSSISTTRIGKAFFWQKDGGNSSGGFGSTHQLYKFGARDIANAERSGFLDDNLLYTRDITVVNETTTNDRRWLYGQNVPVKPITEKPKPIGDGKGATFAPLKFIGVVKLDDVGDSRRDLSKTKPSASDDARKEL